MDLLQTELGIGLGRLWRALEAVALRGPQGGNLNRYYVSTVLKRDGSS